MLLSPVPIYQHLAG